MATHLIGYDLHPKHGETYSNLIDAIKALGNWWHCLDSTWLVQSNLTHIQVRDKLWAHMKADDQLLVVDVSGDARAWEGFSQNCADWLRKNV